MARLYDLGSDYLGVASMMGDGETDEQVILDTLESISGEIEDKAENYAKIMKEQEGYEETLETEINRLTEKKKQSMNLRKRMTKSLFQTMKATGKKKFKTPLFSFNIQKNGGRQAVAILDKDHIPEDFLVPQPAKPDMDKIRKFLKQSGNSDWATLVPVGEHLCIR